MNGSCIPFQLRLGDSVAKTEQLSPMEAALLAYLIDHRGRPVDQQELLQEVWGYHASVRSRTAYATVHTLRKRLGSDAWITTVRGQGFQLAEAVVLVPLDPPKRPKRPVVARPAARDASLAKLSTWWSSGASIGYVVGPPGVGKTHLVSYFVQAECPGALWVAWSESLKTPSAAICAALGLPDSLEPAGLTRALSGHEVDLLVFDHWPAMEEVAALAEAGPRILVITQVAPSLSSLDVLAIPPLPPSAMRALIREVAGVDLPAETPLLTYLGGIPLAATLLAPVLRSLPLEVVVARLRDDPLLGTIDDAYARALQRGWLALTAGQQEVLGVLAALAHSPDYGCLLALTNDVPDAVLTELIAFGLVETTRIDGALRYRVAPAWAAVAQRKPDGVPRDALLAWAVREVEASWRALWGDQHHRVVRKVGEVAPTLLSLRDVLPLETHAQLVCLLGLLPESLPPSQLLDELGRATSDEPEVRMTLARTQADLLRRLRRLPEARAVLDAAQPHLDDPHLSGQLDTQRALIALAAFAHEEAAEHIERALTSIRPRTLFHRYARAVAGLVAWYRGDSDRARAVLQSVLLRLPVDSEGRPLLGVVVLMGVLAVLTDLGEPLGEELERASTMASELGDTRNQATLTLFAARDALAGRAFEDVAGWLDRSERLHRRLGHDPNRSLIPILRGLSAMLANEPMGAVEPLLDAAECGERYIEVWGRGLLVMAARRARLSVEDLVDDGVDAVVEQVREHPRARVLVLALEAELEPPHDRSALAAAAERSATGRLLLALLDGTISLGAAVDHLQT